jgi:endonuclease/exonuclease/phosphatase family metal-dependent hydrolase
LGHTFGGGNGFGVLFGLGEVDGDVDLPVLGVGLPFQILLDTLGADIVGLNEMRGKGADPEFEAQVENLASLTGMKYYHFALAINLPQGPYGNGFLSKIPILKAETVMIPDPEPKKNNGYYETRCVLKVVLAGGVTVLVTHMGLNSDEQENAVRTVMENLADEKCILMGDFNVRPENPVLEPIRDCMKDTADLFTQELVSFPSDKPNRKIDYIFVSPDVTVLDADIPSIVAADHRPHIAVVE